MYDAIIIGARVAGSPTAMLLARKGWRVLLLDRTNFPSDTLSTHQMQIPASHLLKSWGLLDKVLATNPGAAHHATFDIGPVVFDGTFPNVDGINSVYSPRRVILDNILVDAAVEAGAELSEGFVAQELLFDGKQVVGIRGRTRNGASITERARMVIGADGRHSVVAKAVNARRYNEYPVMTCGYYSYWEGVSLKGGEIYRRGRRTVTAWPTNDNLAMIYVAWPAAEFNKFRADVETNYQATIDLVPSLAERVRAGKRIEPIKGTGDIPNFFRKPYGSGWALVGDAGYIKDPISGMGMSDAFRDAQLLVNALESISNGRSPANALGDYEQRRNMAAKPYYSLNMDAARMNVYPAQQIRLLKTLANDPVSTQKFFGMLTGVVHPNELFNPQNMIQILGISGVAKLILSRILPQRRTSDYAAV